MRTERLRGGLGRALLLLGFALSSTAWGEGRALSTATGAVTDAKSHSPLSDVMVTATSSELEDPEVAVTDSDGFYRVLQLPPGTYTLRFERQDYKPFVQPDVLVTGTQPSVVNVQLARVQHAEQSAVEVNPAQGGSRSVAVAAVQPAKPAQSQGSVALDRSAQKSPSAVIDVTTTETGLTLTSTFAENMPISPASPGNGGIRSFSGLALAAPQVSADLFGISMVGTTSPENAYLIDGLSFSDTGFGVNNRNGFTPGAGGTAGSDFSVEFVDQLNVITGGYMPEYGRSTGGVLSITTKSGGNEFHGSVFATYTPGWLAQKAELVGSANTIIGGSFNLYNAFDVGFTLGGYIIKDKLWFFVGFNPSQYTTEITRTVTPFDASGNPVAGATPTISQNYFNTQTNYSYLGKLTFLINSDNRISLTVAGSPDNYTSPYGFGLNGALSAGSFAGNDNTLDAILRWNAAFLQKKLLLDVMVGWHHQNNNVTALDGTSFGQGGEAAIPDVLQLGTFNLNQFPEDPAISNPTLQQICDSPGGDNKCAVQGYAQGGPGNLLRNVTEDRIQGKAVLTYFLNALGHQTWKLGADVEYISYENKIGYAGSDLYAEMSGAPPSGPGYYVDDRALGSINGPDNPSYSVFQDNKPTALLPGFFLQDSWNILDKVTVNLGVRYDAEYIYDQNGQLALALNNQWSPRLGVIWDPTYKGKSKIYASYALYYEAVPLDLADRALIGNENIIAAHVPCMNPATTHMLCPSSPTTLGRGQFGPNQSWGAQAADKAFIDPNIGPQTTDEFQAGAEYEIFPNARLGVNYTHRGLSQVIEDFSNNAAANYVLGNPGQGVASNFPTPARIYNAYTVSLTKAYANHWQAQVSYTFITLNGNIDGLYTPNQGQLDPNINATYDLPDFLINAFGPLAADQQSRIKAYGSYQFVFTPNLGLTVGAAYTGNSGAPISALGGQILYGADVVYIIPRGSYDRLPWVNQFDLHFTLDISFGQGMQLQIGADIFNLLGSQQVTAVDQSWVVGNLAVAAIPNGTIADLQHITNPFLVHYVTSGPDSVLNPNFGHATAYQSPRNIRLLARFTF
jgi:hypothetical protein